MLATCTLSLEANESLFSLATRLCRITGIPFADFLGRAAHDLSALRDFPIAATPLIKRMDFRFHNFNVLLIAHSASLYFGTTLEEPFRSEEIQASVKKAGRLLRMSVGTFWAHLRYCPRCAQEEYKAYRYSWWHRDHQLPLTTICLVHECSLTARTLRELGRELPHELCETPVGDGRSKPTQIKFALARFDRYLATGERYAFLESLFGEAKAALLVDGCDAFEAQEICWGRVKAFLSRLASAGLTEPLGDWERIRLLLYRLMQDGFRFSDPVVVVLFIVSVSDVTRGRLDFLEGTWPAA